MKDLKLYQSAVIKAVEEKDATTLVIKGKASVYRTPEGFLQVDRDNELIGLDGLELDSYRKNPIVCIAHQWDRPIGKVTSIEVRNGALEVTAEIYKLTGEENIFEAVQKGILKTFSVSVVPKEYVYHEIHNSDVLEVYRSELVEISLMPVQSNQDAIFNVISSKGVGNSLSVSKKELAQQNGMTCDELDGSCAFKKGLYKPQEKEISVITKSPDIKDQEVIPAVIVVPVIKEPEPMIVPVPDVKAFDEVALVDAITQANLKAEELKEKRQEELQQKANEEAEQIKADAKAKVDNAIAYISEQTRVFVETPDTELDTASIEAFYELISGSVEAIEEKITNVIKTQVV